MPAYFEPDRDVQIVGLAETKSEKDDLKSMLKLSKEKMGIKLKAADVKSIHRLGKKTQNRNRDIIVSFDDTTVRDAFYQKRKSLSVNKDPSKNIYVNDRLTTTERASSLPQGNCIKLKSYLPHGHRKEMSWLGNLKKVRWFKYKVIGI